MEFLSIIGLFGCTLFFHNGFSPIFSVMKESRRPDSIRRLPVYCFFAGKLIFDACTGVLPYTLLQYPCYYVAWIIAERSALASATVFYLVSNSVCFLQMSDTFLCTNVNLMFYSCDVYGYYACLMAGLPYYLNSLVATLVFSLLFKMIRDYAKVYTRFVSTNLAI